MSFFNNAFGSGCGLVLGIFVAGLLIIAVIMGGCTAMIGGCGAIALSPAITSARKAADRAAKENREKISNFENLNDEDRNQIYWEVEKSSFKVADAIGERYSEKGNLSDQEYADKIAREIRTPIAKKYKITYEELIQIFNEGLTATTWGEGRPLEEVLEEDPMDVAEDREVQQESERKYIESIESIESIEIQGSQYRTWTAVDGNYQVEAIFRGMAFGKVKLERKDNSMIIELPIEKLSLEDQNWINNGTYNKKHP